MGPNPDFFEITLRTHLKRNLASGAVKVIGTCKTAKGRPSIMMVRGDIKPEHLEEAKKRNVTLNNDITLSVMAINKENETVVEKFTVTQPDVANKTVA
jgi:hypothetical protein